MTHDALVARLSGYGSDFDLLEWPDYVGDHEFSIEDIDTMLDILATSDLSRARRGCSIQDCVPRHAWRALGQLRASAAVPVLLAALAAPRSDEPLEYHVELPRVLGEIGRSALPLMTEFATGTEGNWGHRVIMLRSAVRLALTDPGCQRQAEAMGNAMLAPLEGNDLYYNSAILTELFKLELADPSLVKEVIHRDLIAFPTIDGNAVREFIRVHRMYEAMR